MGDGFKIIKANGLPDVLVKVWSKVKVFKTLAETNNNKKKKHGCFIIYLSEINYI